MRRSELTFARLIVRLTVVGATLLVITGPVTAGNMGEVGSDEVPSSASPPIDLHDPTIIEAGRVQFAETCSYCHGYEGTGGKAGPLKGRADLTKDYLFDTISNGKRSGSLAMPPWKYSLDNNTIWVLVAYVLELGSQPAPGAK